MRMRIFTTAVLSVVSLAIAGGQAASGATVVPVLGSAAFAGPNGEGWGTARPAKVYNGGDPSGLVREIHWVTWGGKTATGFGLNLIFKPHGGYYSRPVIIELLASGLGRCSAGGPPAYSRLSVRAPERPEAQLGPWSSWSGAETLCKFGF
jgi:hypothetical protein